MTACSPTRSAVPLGSLTTLRLGGPAERLVVAETEDALVTALREADTEAHTESDIHAAADRDTVRDIDGGAVPGASPRALVLGGGSNLVVADDGVPGTTVQVATRGLGLRELGDGRTELTAEAGEDWDAVVAATLAEGRAGLECLSGIPGRVGAVPVQNVGAYGVEIADLLLDVDLYDRRVGRVRQRVPAAELGLGYRTSVLKGRDDAVVLRVRLALSDGPVGAPVRYPELARALGVAVGDAAPPIEVREAVLALRRSKGMVLDAGDHDTWSAGSFFTNPVLSAEEAARVTRAAGAAADGMPSWPAPGDRVKLSAAWLISHAGFDRGHPGPGGRVTLSTRHSLALTNRGGGTTADLLALAREVRDGVFARFGVRLAPEPVLVGCTL